MAIDILLDDDGDFAIGENGLVWGDSFAQEVAEILPLNQGDVIDNPMIGPGLMRFVKGAANRDEIDSLLAKHFKLDHKDYRKIKEAIKLK